MDAVVIRVSTVWTIGHLRRDCSSLTYYQNKMTGVHDVAHRMGYTEYFGLQESTPLQQYV